MSRQHRHHKRRIRHRRRERAKEAPSATVQRAVLIGDGEGPAILPARNLIDVIRRGWHSVRERLSKRRVAG